ncbi:hypothetical protein P3X46_010830 [Hevea brasiliensis]|uniref:Protein kinase domain-containing protein n=1 Tax=Hevea brasiliensis TaxID=3981 RepID=A0ABQ9MHB1_HEVBR|nr:hypothetical protein P3X46_010830 [Hevea brasiliensis]
MKAFSESFVRPIWGLPKILRCCNENSSKYIFEMEDNLDSLKDAVEQLKNKKEDIKLRVKREESSYKECIYKVTDWLYRADCLEAQANKIIAEGEEELQKRRHGCCSSQNLSCEVGNKVCEVLKAVQKSLIEGNFDVVVKRTPHDVVDVIHVETTVGFESKLDDVWRCLYDESLRIIGIYGMPGVGKSTLLKKVSDELVGTHNSTVVIWVDVSKEACLDTIQNAIRNQLGIPDETWKNTDKGNRAAEISRLLDSRKFILILDDLWDRLDLSNVGVPQSNRSKIVFTTRSEGVCDDMNAQIKLKLKCMSQEEAMRLFWMEVGEETRNSRAQFEYVVETLNKEVCQGLPLALIVISQVLAGMRDPEEWEHAISKLQNHPSKLPGMDHIFHIFEPSYDRLEDAIIKDCFLYNSILPGEIRKDELINLWIGEGFLDMSTKYLGEYIIKRLELSCLLESDELNDSVRMHGVSRVFGLWLAHEYGKKDNKILLQERDSTKWIEAVRISIDGQIDVEPPPTPCLQVQTLLIRDTNLSVFPTWILHSKKALTVLDLSKNIWLAELPDSIGALINLHYINLSFTSIKELPIEVKNLKNLKVLLLDYTKRFQIIPKGVISSFPSLQLFSKLDNESFDDTTLLEELKCSDCVNDINVSLFSDQTVERLLNSQKLLNCIRNLSLREIKSLNISVSVLSRMVHLEELIIEDCECLHFESDNDQYYVLNIRGLRIQGCSTIDDLTWLIFAPRLKTLDLRSCRSLLQVIGNDFKSEEIKELDQRLGIFSNLKKLYLGDLPSLRCICAQVLHFPILEVMLVIDCPNLLNLPFDLHSARRLREIKGTRSWWNQLHWKNTAARDAFALKFQDGFEADRFQEIRYSRTAPPLTDQQEVMGPPTRGEDPKYGGKGGYDASGSGRVSTVTVPSTPRTKGEILQSSNLRSFSFSELKAATRNFRPDCVLGEGGFGCVYKGWIDEHSLTPVRPRTGMAIAVRRLNQEGVWGHQEWLTEIFFLEQLHHPNIVKLIGYCLEDDHRLLVYEFMPRGSLENHLFRRSNVQPLSWNLRIKISLDAARGLSFLHSDEAKVIHRNLKASNILLDSNYNAKLSDFWLAKDGPTGSKSHVSTRVMGTYGYAAPEYIATGHLTAKSDTYSFGVVLLEILSGRRAIDKSKPYREQNLVEWARPFLGSKRKVFQVMDARLEGQYSLKDALKAANLAVQCLSTEPRFRPNMEEVVKALEQLLESIDNPKSSSKFKQ